MYTNRLYPPRSTKEARRPPDHIFKRCTANSIALALEPSPSPINACFNTFDAAYAVTKLSSVTVSNALNIGNPTRFRIIVFKKYVIYVISYNGINKLLYVPV